MEKEKKSTFDKMIFCSVGIVVPESPLANTEVVNVMPYRDLMDAMLQGYEYQETDGILEQLIAIGRGWA